MCKAPKPPKPKEPKKPQFLRNKYLDAFVGDSQAVAALRTGRSSLRIPLGSPTPIRGREPGESLVQTRTNTNTPTTPRPTPIGPRRRMGGRGDSRLVHDARLHAR